MEKVISLSAETNEVKFGEYQETEYMIAKFGFLSTRPNSHKIAISADVLKASAPSILGKWVVADPQYGEKMTHTATEGIVGMFPKDQEVEFSEDDDGYLRAYANAVISKRYAKDFCDMFNEYDDTRPVSIEATFEMSEDDENTAVSFDIKSVCVLGHSVRPSCPESDVSVIRFSEEEAEEYYKTNKTVVLETVFEVSTEKDRKEDKMAEEKIIDFATIDLCSLRSELYEYMRNNRNWDYYVEGFYEDEGGKFAIVTDDANNYYKVALSFDENGKMIPAEEKVEVVKEYLETGNVTKFAIPEPATEAPAEEQTFAEESKETANEAPVEETVAMEEVKEEHNDDVDFACKIAEMEATIKEKEDIIMSKDNQITAMEAELSELRTFKSNVERQEITSKVNTLMAEVKEFMDAESFDALYEEGRQIPVDGYDAFANKAKAMCFGAIKNKKNNGMLTFSMPIESKKSESDNVWDRLAKNYK